MELEVHQILRLPCKAYERVDCHEKIRQTNKSQRQRHALPLPRKMTPQKRQVVLLPESCQVLCMLYKNEIGMATKISQLHGGLIQYYHG